MKISDVLRTKGSAVITVAPQETIASLLELLAQHNIGAVVVSTDGAAVDGIVSEARRGAPVARAAAGNCSTPPCRTS